MDVHGYEAGDGNTGVSRFCLLAWSVGPDSDAGNLTVSGAPAAATGGAIENVAINWAGLDDGLWLGGVEHKQGETSVGFTLVDINVNGLPDQDPAAFVCP